MRTDRDVRNSPLPGDVVVYGPQWQLARVEVTEVANGRVFGVMDSEISVTYSQKQWVEWMSNAEVLHIAEAPNAK